MEMNEELDRPLPRYILGCCLTAGHNASEPWLPTICNQVQIGGRGVGGGGRGVEFWKKDQEKDASFFFFSCANDSSCASCDNL